MIEKLIVNNNSMEYCDSGQFENIEEGHEICMQLHFHVGWIMLKQKATLFTWLLRSDFHADRFQ